MLEEIYFTLHNRQIGCKNHWLNDYRTLRCHLYCHFLLLPQSDAGMNSTDRSWIFRLAPAPKTFPAGSLWSAAADTQVLEQDLRNLCEAHCQPGTNYHAPCLNHQLFSFGFQHKNIVILIGTESTQHISASIAA